MTSQIAGNRDPPPLPGAELLKGVLGFPSKQHHTADLLLPLVILGLQGPYALGLQVMLPRMMRRVLPQAVVVEAQPRVLHVALLPLGLGLRQLPLHLRQLLREPPPRRLGLHELMLQSLDLRPMQRGTAGVVWWAVGGAGQGIA